jgi:far upstream element-binding protein
MSAQPPSAPPSGAYLPQPTSSGSLDLSGIKPSGSGAVSIAEAIAKAKNIAANRGVPSYDPRAGSPRDDPRLAGRGYQPSRSRSRSPPRRDAYSNPYRDERREDPRRGSYRRSNSPDRGYRNSREPQSRGQNEGDSETIRVKSSLVGLIIGRAGENLRKVESESGARVQFLQSKDPHATERQCTITGPVRSRESAKAAIFGIIEENGGANVMQDKGAYTAGMPGRAKVNLPALRDGEDSTQVMVPDKTVGLIIGRGGETIKDLQERSGCHVNILGETKSINGLRPINLIGSVQAVGVAKDLILEIVESDSRGQQGGAGTGSNAMNPTRERSYDGGRGQPAQGGQGGSTKTIQVPSQAVGMIIGKGGETIKDLQRNSGCKINVHQPQAPDINRDIDLEGTPRQMEEAERVIWEKVETVRERDGNSGGRGGRSGGGGGGGRGGNSHDQQPSYDGYSQQQQQPAMAGYGQYQPQQQQAPPQMPSFQMPTLPQQTAPAQSSSGTPAQDPNAAYQQFYAQWYMQQMMAQQPSAGAPGQQ